MPIYEYKCSKCGKIFEELQKITDKPLTRCKICNGRVERLVSNSSFQFKGTGWYVTDYARKTPTSTGETDTDKGGKKGEGKAAEGSEAKPPKQDKTPTTKD